MKQDDFIISERDSPIARKRKLKLYYYVILALTLITEMWPVFVILIFTQNQLIKIINQAINKHSIKFKKHTPIKDSYNSNFQIQTKKNTVGIDYKRNILTILALVVFIIFTLSFYYIPKFINHPNNGEFIEETINTKAIMFSDYKNIKEYNLENTQLNYFPEHILKANNLEILNLSYNNIKDALPAEIKNFNELRILDISNNKMTGIPAEIGQLGNLERLDISNNLLTGLPHELANLNKLEILNISGNNYSVYDLEIISKGLKNTKIIKN